MRNTLTKLSAFALFLLLTSSFLVSQTKTILYQELPTAAGGATGSGIFFGASMTSSSITVTFAGPADRWVALGLGTFMSPADVFIYSNGKPGAIHTLDWYDYYNNSNQVGGVNKDLSQDWVIVSTGTVATNQRTVTATRALSTGDVKDVAISYSATALSLVWARGATADYTIAYHGTSNRAYGIVLNWLTPPTASFTTLSNTLCAGSSLSYSNHSTGSQLTYTWNFEGGTPATSNSIHPTVHYTQPGTYSVSLSASNVLGSDVYTQVNYITVTPTVVPAITIGLSGGNNPSCAASPVSFSANAVNGGSSPSYQWKVNGVNAGNNSNTYTSNNLQTSDVVSCNLVSNAVCAIPATASAPAITMTVNSTAPASVSVALASGINPICTGNPASFTAAPGNGGVSPFYQWQVNGAAAGANSATFTTNSLADGDVVSCMLNSSEVCAITTSAISSGITLSVSTLLTPSVAVVQAAGNAQLCAGAPATFTALGSNGGSSPVYQWQVNGASAGNNSPFFTSSTLNNADTLICIFSSALSCANPVTAASEAITLTVHPSPGPPVIGALGSATFCAGDSVALSSSSGTNTIWSTGVTAASITVISQGSVSATTQGTNGCNSQPSSSIFIAVNPLPAVSLNPIAPLCVSDGPLVLTQGLPAGGTYVSAGVSNGVFFPDQYGAGTYTLSYFYADPNGCLNKADLSLLVDLCLGITTSTQEQGLLSVYPNPTSGRLMLRSVHSLIRSVSLSDISGKLLTAYPGNAQASLEIDLSDRTSGLYTLCIFLEDGSRVCSRVSKNE